MAVCVCVCVERGCGGSWEVYASERLRWWRHISAGGLQRSSGPGLQLHHWSVVVSQWSVEMTPPYCQLVSK